jgi:hypothetical protein
MSVKVVSLSIALCLCAGCALAQRDSGTGSKHSHRFNLPPEKAARCFARNAEEHSSALMSEVRVESDGSAEVTVRVKNGVLYATADIRRAGQAASGTITLMVRTSGRRSDLLDALVQGC